MGQVMLDDRAYLVRWEYSYSSWTLFTCEIEMLLHVVSTAGEGSEGDSTGGGKVDMLRGFQNKIQNHLDCDSCNLFIKVSETIQ